MEESAPVIVDEARLRLMPVPTNESPLVGPEINPIFDEKELQSSDDRYPFVEEVA